MTIRKNLLGSIETKLAIANNPELIYQIEAAGNQIINTLINSGKILIAGNGGSAADAQHFAAELVGKFMHENRQALPALALTTNSSIVTAIGNDFGYEKVFLRNIEAFGQKGDIFFGISTSGNSRNIINAIHMANHRGLFTIGLLGNNGGKMKDFCHINITVPSSNTQHIQESHIAIIHSICQLIDDAFI